MKLPVFKAVAMTFAFLAANALDLIKIVWLPIVLLIALITFGIPSQTFTTTVDPSASNEEALAAFSSMLPFFFLMMILSVAFYLVVFTGILRLVLRGEKPRLPFYVGFGGDEFRLLGTWVLLLLVFIGAYIGIALVGGAAAFLAVSSRLLGGIAALIVIVVGLVAFCWLMLRMSLATPATIGLRTIGLGPSWNTARGNVWRLFGYWLIWGVIFLIAEIVIILALMPGYFEAMSNLSTAMGSGSVEQVEAASRQLNAASVSMYDGSPAAIARFAAGALIGVLPIVLCAVAGGVAWRLMTETNPEKHFE